MITRDFIDRKLAEKAERLKDPCSRPRCGAKPGEECRTPNGYRTHHASRGRVAAVNRPHRLSDAQAQRIEWAAEQGVFEAPDQYATLRGDATKRACADALERAGLIVQVGTTEYDWRIFALTVDGWKAYHESPLVIRRVPDDKHPPICPCRPKDAFEQVEAINAKPEVRQSQSQLRARHEETQRVLRANVKLRDVSAEARGSGGAKVLDITARLAARRGGPVGGGAA